ncbi:MAG: peptidoglycan-binding protein [Candidatus Omnitrophica bacterium]|nr:peptidoglycan-binding protein [Candidatus Omnitrophota bacterium]MCK5259486.1 peptidoglycan-binding protein [Candidatus Omnitrophota bacterium]
MKSDCHHRGYIFACLLLCLSFSGCDAVYRLLDKEGAEEKALVGDIIPFESNAVVEEIQSLLYLYGYNAGKVDGVLGLRTRNAIEKFQRDNGLEMTRFADQATWEKLSLFTKNGLVVDLRLNARLVQSLLKEAGFDPGKIDGKIGTKTKDAVLAFQKAHNLKVDGKIGYQTLSRLAAFLTDEPQSK